MIIENLTKAIPYLYCTFLFHRWPDINGYLGVAILTLQCPLLRGRGSLSKNGLTGIPALIFSKGDSVCPDIAQADATSKALKPIMQPTQMPFELMPFPMVAER